jgi:outer membrane lipoprotein SlyB
MIKKYISTFIMAAMLAVAVPALSGTALGQTRYYSNETRQARVYRNRNYKKPNVYKRNQTAFNLAIGAGAGAILGGLFGGKKGAGIGALIGAGGGAITTYVQKKKQKNNNYRRY